MEKYQEQTWDRLKKVLADGNKVPVIFGTNVIASLFFMHFPYIQDFIVVDNALEKQGHGIAEYAFGLKGNKLPQKSIVSFAEGIKEINIDNAIIIINGEKSYKEMIKEAHGAGFVHVFATVLMEEDEATVEREPDESLRSAMYKYYARECTRLPIESKKIFVYTEGYYGDHGKAIMKQLLQEDSSFDVVWAMKDEKSYLSRAYRRCTTSDTLKYIKEFETSKVVLCSSEIPIFLIKRKEQTYFQTTHWSSVTLKTFGLDFYGFHKLSQGVKLGIHDRDAIDYLFTGSDFDERTFRKAFGYTGKALRVGSPRSDILFHPESTREEVSEKLGLEKDKKYILYAPTFRANMDSGYDQKAYEGELDYSKLTSTLSEKFGGKWGVLLKFHPDISKRLDGVKLDETVLNVTNYSDIQELIVLCDAVITDYSSLMFEPAYAHKPVFLYAPDRDSYIDKDRPLLIPYDELPFPIAISESELYEKIKTLDKKEYDTAIDKFLNKYGVHEDGHAAERAAKMMLAILDKSI